MVIVLKKTSGEIATLHLDDALPETATSGQSVASVMANYGPVSASKRMSEAEYHAAIGEDGMPAFDESGNFIVRKLVPMTDARMAVMMRSQRKTASLSPADLVAFRNYLAFGEDSGIVAKLDAIP